MNLLLNNLNISLDAPSAWGIYFQDSATPQMEGLVELHDNIMYYLVVILFAVGWVLLSIVRNYVATKSPISHKYLNHGTLIELIWTITPAVILMLIAFPSFKLLYLMDEVSDPSMSVLAEGRGGPKPYILNKIVNTWKGQRKYNIFTLKNGCARRSLQAAKPPTWRSHNRIKTGSRIGPHNQDVTSVKPVIGSLLACRVRRSPNLRNFKFQVRTNSHRSLITKYENKTEMLNPNWITGFTDGKGSFRISNLKSKDRAIGWIVTPIFAIKLSDKDTELLLRIKFYFGVGNIVINKSNGSVIYSVKSIKDICSVIILHFCKYPLWRRSRPQKQADFFLFKNIVELIVQKEHLGEAKQGLKKIVEFKSVLNKGLPLELAEAFPGGLSPIKRPTVLLPENIDIQWFVGFIQAEGCFYVNIVKDASKSGYTVQLNFNVTQHIRDLNLFILLKKWLGCGYVHEITKNYRVNLVITSRKDIVNILFPIFNKYPLRRSPLGGLGIKKLNYDDFLSIIKQGASSEKKEHLTLDGGGYAAEKIRVIKSGLRLKASAGRNILDINVGFASNITSTSKNPRWLRLKEVMVGSFRRSQKREFHNYKVKPGKRIGPHNLDCLSVILGSLLSSNGSVGRSVEGTRICYRQSSKNKEYLFWLYSFFYHRGYCSNLEPRRSTIKLKHGGVAAGIECEDYRYEFNTFTFRSFNWIHEMFYHKGKKVIKAKLENYITPLCLAVWMMSQYHGYKELKLSTCFCSEVDIDKLIAMLKNRYGFICYSFKDNNSYFGVGIANESKDSFIALVQPYLDKVGLNIVIPAGYAAGETS